MKVPLFGASAHMLMHRIDCWRFSAKRADYYDYLAALLSGMQGTRTLRDVFLHDARRYGRSSLRGRLSQAWLQAFEMVGGDLHATWNGCFAPSELALIRTAQAHGNAALAETLAALSSAQRLSRQAGRILSSTLWSSVVAMGLLAGMLAAVPLFTLPGLLHAFAAVPASFHGRRTQALSAFAGLLQAHWPLLAVLAIGGGALLLWSIPNLGGALRRKLDPWMPWRLYRDVQALRFLKFQAILLDSDGAGPLSLRTTLAMQKLGASTWLAAHMDLMLARIDAGLTGPDTFDSGLMDRELFWFFSDMAMARGLRAGLRLSAERLRSHVIDKLARRAAALRWCILLACLGCLLALALWHYAVIDELRRSLMIFYASQ
ncbi:hypothetical protein H0A70_09500 [Alcaligenaceae bacterium]|nr:hypothetical protein [Alcaligenaceae bacterium]